MFSRREAEFYEFFKQHDDKAYTALAFVDVFFADDTFGIDESLVEKTLMEMVSEGKIKGVYAKGYYYYHF